MKTVFRKMAIPIVLTTVTITSLNVGNAHQVYASTRPKLFILLQGIQSTSSTASIFDPITQALQQHWPTSTGNIYENFSYTGPGTTFGYADSLQHISTSAYNLSLYLSAQNVAGKDVYIIGYSLGGAVAAFYASIFQFPTGTGGRLAGIITLDSPLGGVSSADEPTLCYNEWQNWALQILGPSVQGIVPAFEDIAPGTTVTNGIMNYPTESQHVPLLTMANKIDCFVEYHKAILAGATQEVYNSGGTGFDSHKTILSAPATPELIANWISPGGMWNSPADGQTYSSSVHLSAHAYQSGGSGTIDHVNFTALYGGAWHVICSPSTPESGDIYGCDWNLSGIPQGNITISFDVYDTSGGVNQAPNGEHVIGNGVSTPGIPSQPPDPAVTGITVLSASPQGDNENGGATFHPNVVLQATNGVSIDCSQDFLQNMDGNQYSTGPNQGCKSLGNGQYQFYFYTPMTAPSSPGIYHSKWQIWHYPSHIGPVIDIWFTVPGVIDGIKLCQDINYGGACNTYTYTSNDACIPLVSGAQRSVQFVNSYLWNYDVETYDDTGCSTLEISISPNTGSIPDIGYTHYDRSRAIRIEILNSIQVCSDLNYGDRCESFYYTNDSTCISLDHVAGFQKSLRWRGTYRGAYNVILYQDTGCSNNSTQFNASNGDRSDIGSNLYNAFDSMRMVQVPTPGMIQYVPGSFSLTPSSITTGEAVTARFAVQNIGGQSFTIPVLTAAVRYGTAWSDPNYDFPYEYNVAVQPGQTYYYQETASFPNTGSYFVQPDALMGSWAPVYPSSPTTFTVVVQSQTYQIFDDALAPGWSDSSYRAPNNVVYSPVEKGSVAIISSINADGGLSFGAPSGFSTTPYTSLHFALQASQPGQRYEVYVDSTYGQPLTVPVPLDKYGGQPVPGQWTVYNIPLADLGGSNISLADIVIHDATSSNQPPLYVDDVALTNSTSPNVNGVQLLISAWQLTGNNGASEQDLPLPANALQGMGSVQVTFNLHGATFGSSDDAASLIFVQNNDWRAVNLTQYGQNGLDGLQTITIPLSAFHKVGDPPTLLDPTQPVSNLNARFWNSGAFAVDITSVVLLPAAGSANPAGLIPTAWQLSGNNGASEQDASIPQNTLVGKSSVQVTFDLHGGTFGSADDEASIAFVQNGDWRAANIVLYGQNGKDGLQTVTVPLSAFHKVGDPSTVLDTTQPVTNLHARFWNSGAFTVDITSIVVQ